MVSGYPSKFPLLKIASLKWGYNQPTKYQVCPSIPSLAFRWATSPSVHSLVKELGQIEQILSYFHLGCATLLQRQCKRTRAQLLGNLDKGMLDILYAMPKVLTKEHRIEMCTAVAKHGANIARRMEKACGLEKMELLPQLMASAPLGNVTFMDMVGHFKKDPEEAPKQPAEAQKKTTKDTASARIELQPKMISYDCHGQPITKQDETNTQKAELVEEIAWQRWENASNVLDSRANMQARGKAMVAITSLYNYVHNTADSGLTEKRLAVLNSLSLTRVSGEKTPKLELRSNLEILKHELILPVPCRKESDLLDPKISKHPRAVKVSVSTVPENSPATLFTFMISPDLSLPPIPAVAGEELEWTGGNSAHVFWAMTQDHVETKWNCELVTISDTIVCSCNFAELTGKHCSMTETSLVEVPCITNTRTIPVGENIVLRCRPPKEKEKATRQAVTWQTSEKRKVKELSAALQAEKRDAEASVPKGEMWDVDVPAAKRSKKKETFTLASPAGEPADAS